MAYEYKLVSEAGSFGSMGIHLFGKLKARWTHLEEEVNELVGDGWEVVSSSTANFLILNVLATIVLRKATNT